MGICAKSSERSEEPTELPFGSFSTCGTRAGRVRSTPRSGNPSRVNGGKPQMRPATAQIAALMARVADLERRLGLDSSNSGKPPSSDGLKKPVRVRSLREPSGKALGGQKGHPGETLRQAQTPDVVVDHYPQACSRCGMVLTAAMATGHGARQIFDLPEPRPLVVTEHRAHACCCTSCGARTKAGFPTEVVALRRARERVGHAWCLSRRIPVR
jgi:Family of unknown function (DUF6444)